MTEGETPPSTPESDPVRGPNEPAGVEDPEESQQELERPKRIVAEKSSMKREYPIKYP